MLLKTLAKDKEIIRISNELYTNNKESTDYVTKRFETIANNNEGIISIYLGIGEKELISYPKKDIYIMYKNTDEEWYTNTINNKLLTYLKPYNLGKKSTITISYPIEYNNEIIGVISMDINFEYIAKKTSAFQLDNNELMGIIIETDEKYIFQYINEEHLKSKIQEKYITQDTAFLNSHIFLPELAQVLTDKEYNDKANILKLNINEKTYIGKVKKDTQYEWYTLLAINEDDFMRSTNALLKDISLIGIILSGIGILVIFTIIRNLGKNINSIRKTVERVEKGDLNIKCDKYICKRNDELGLLANGINSMISQQSRMFDSISNMIITDPLTMLKNRRGVSEYIEEIEGHYNCISVIMLDIDYFKLYNDNYGHTKGDNVLKEFSKILKHTVDELTNSNNSIIARYGGEEFLVILKDYTRDDAINIAKQFIENLSINKIPHEYSLANKFITSSIGISTTIGDEKSISELIQYADIALYNSKENGRNRYTHYNDIQ